MDEYLFGRLGFNLELGILCLLVYEFWDTPNPKKKSTPLTPKQKASAKAKAKAAGRPYPNLIDNAAAKRSKKK